MQDVLEEFQQTIESAAARLRLISDSASAAPLAPGKWSAKEVLGHLIDSAANNHQRFVRAQLTNELVFPPYEQEEWVRLQRYNEEHWSLLIDLWRSYNLHLKHLMAHVPEETRTAARRVHNLDRIAWKTVSRDEPATLEYFMRDYIGHMKNHLAQILREC